jgi:hypothetical protein
VSSFYLGPNRPRLRATTWADIVVAAQSGVLGESHWVELKKDIPKASPNGDPNLELAKDLASLSVDGGVLIVGVRDKTFEVVGAAVTGRIDRITAVAAGKITPPLQVAIADALPHPDNPELAVLVVTVPASENAPHMVGGHYWGRNNVGKQILGDEDVRRLLTTQQARAAGFEQRIRALTAQLDPLPLEDRKNSHLYLLAEPATGAGAVPGGADRQYIDGAALVRALGGNLGDRPSFHNANQSVPHPDGTLLVSPTIKRPGASVEDRSVQLLLTDDGVIQVACGQGSRLITADYEGTMVKGISGMFVMRFVYQFCRLAALMSEHHLGYTGPWRVGIYLDHLAGAHPIDDDDYSDVYRRGTFQPDHYFQQLLSSTEDLRARPQVVADELTLRLLRGLGIEDMRNRYREAL